MRSVPLVLTALATLVLAAACSTGGAATPAAPSATPTPAAPSPSAGSGGTGNGGAPAAIGDQVLIVVKADGHNLVKDKEIVLTFKGGQLGINAGCNGMSGSYEIKDGKLVVGPMMSTEMACDDALMQQDQWIAAFVNGAAIAVTGDGVTLTKDGVTLTAKDKAAVHPAKPLAGTTWVVTSLVAQDTVSSVPMGLTATVQFSTGKVSVNTGCNTGQGTADAGDKVIRFGAIGITKMACKEDAANQLERAVLAVLAGDVAWTIDGDTLQLRGAGGGLDLTAQS